MRQFPAALALALLASTSAGTALAPAPLAAQEVLAGSDPCLFFRNRAWGKGLLDPATEMLWACEAIVTRRSAGVPLSDRLTATEAALERFRLAVREAGRAAFRERAPATAPAVTPVAGADRDQEIARTTGVLAALAAIRENF